MSDVASLLAETAPKQPRGRYWLEVALALLVVTIVALVAAALAREQHTVVTTRDLPKGTLVTAQDVATARLPQLDGSLTDVNDAIGSVTTTDLSGGSALRQKHVARQQAVTVTAIHRGETLHAENVAFKVTSFVRDALERPADLGRVAARSIPAGAIVNARMLQRDVIAGRATRSLAPFVLLGEHDTAPKIAGSVVTRRGFAPGEAIRAADLLRIEAPSANTVVVSCRVLAGALRPAAGSRVSLLRARKDGGAVQIDAVLLGLQTGKDASTAIVAVDAASVTELASADALQLAQPLRGGRG